MPNYEILKEKTSEYLELDDISLNRFKKYSDMLIEWNEKINLTAITEPEDIMLKHFLDCLITFKNFEIPQNASIIDVGTGAGFPGMVLKIARPDIKLTLLDGLNKRLVFLKELCNELGFTDVEIIHSRAEEGGKNPNLREKFDFATARAVAKLNVLCEYCLPFVKIGGGFLALKGPTANDEIKNSYVALKTLGGKFENTYEEKLPNGDTRVFVLVKKISQTPTNYPRVSAKISKKPL